MGESEVGINVRDFGLLCIRVHCVFTYEFTVAAILCNNPLHAWRGGEGATIADTVQHTKLLLQHMAQVQITAL